MGGVHCLGLSPKKNRFFYAFPNENKNVNISGGANENGPGVSVSVSTFNDIYSEQQCQPFMIAVNDNVKL